ncbi:MAG: hypothetical protein DRQ57_15545 [Gammaproteobacteria bacterium]|nr:MAG: hypothetical protein DRQ57_15545 [Gammaproteobacteria bacterium]
MEMGLKDKIAIVTGGSIGLGRSIAIALAEEGVNIAIADINEAEGKKTVEELNKSVKAIFIKTDVSNSANVDTMVKAVITEFGRIDILINNAGIVGPQGPWSELSEESFDLVVGINFKGTFLCTKAVTPQMIKQQYGKIVNVSSCAGKSGEQFNGVYSTTKAAALNMAQSLSGELGEHNINVNAVCPAAMDTGLMEKVYRERSEFFGYDAEELRKSIQSGYKLPRNLTTLDASNVVVFLVSDRTNMMTGQGVNITGGIEVH